MGVLAWALVALAVLLVLVLLALSVPLVLVAEARADPAVRASGRVELLFGLVRIPLHASPTRRMRTRATPAADGQLRRFLAAWRTPGFPRAARTLARRALRAVRVREASLHARVGTGDPAETGELLGLLAPLPVLAALVPRASLTLTPDWGDEPALDAHARATVSCVPLRLVGVALAFAVTPAVWRGTRAWRRAA